MRAASDRYHICFVYRTGLSKPSWLKISCLSSAIPSTEPNPFTSGKADHESNTLTLRAYEWRRKQLHESSRYIRQRPQRHSGRPFPPIHQGCSELLRTRYIVTLPNKQILTQHHVIFFASKILEISRIL